MLSLKIDIEIQGQKPAIADFELPQSWNEVPADILPHLASLYLATQKDMDDYDRTVRALSILAWREWPTLQQLEPVELYDLCKLIDWVFDKLDLTENKLPEIKIAGETYFGPGPEMENLSFGEWCETDPLILNFVATGDLTYLRRLAAVLYRPTGKGPQFEPGHALYRGDRRERLNSYLLDSRAVVMGKLTKIQLQVIYLYYVSCRHLIIQSYPNFFPQKATKDEKPSELDGFGWLGMYDDLRGDPKFGGPEALEAEPIHSVFMAMERTILKNKQLKEEYDL